ncbi:hypothetical protein D3C71_1919100 [compost metagenome]
MSWSAFHVDLSPDMSTAPWEVVLEPTQLFLLLTVAPPVMFSVPEPEDPTIMMSVLNVDLAPDTLITPTEFSSMPTQVFLLLTDASSLMCKVPAPL